MAAKTRRSIEENYTNLVRFCTRLEYVDINATDTWFQMLKQ